MRSSDEIIVPGHPRWLAFASRLNRARFCFGTTEQARSALAGMTDVNVEGSLHALARLGGTSDCQVELDVVHSSAVVGAAGRQRAPPPRIARARQHSRV